MRSSESWKRWQKKNEKRKRKRKEELAERKKGRGEELIFHLVKTMNHFFPYLFDRIREIEEYRKKSEYELAELITAGIALYLFKEGSRNAFNNDRQEKQFKENYRRIFNMRLPHMDTVDKVMRTLEESELERLKASMVHTLIEKKVLHKFRIFGYWFLVAVDGSGVMSFSERHCERCLEKTSKNGKTTWFHNVLEAKLVCSNGFSISLATEWIENPEGEYTKQDCEQKAFKRLAENLKMMYPRLPLCIAADGLYPNQSFFRICKENQWRFIVTFKEGNLPSVWKEIERRISAANDNTLQETSGDPEKKETLSYRWINTINYHGYQLHWSECVELIEHADKNKSARFVHLTDFEIMRANVAEISHSGRLRWKIENEGFNTQKNHGYNLQHKYSRVSLRAAKNYYQCLQIAHLINQLAELSTQVKKLLVGKMTIKHLWKSMIGFLTYMLIDCQELSVYAHQRTQIRFQ